MNEELLKTVQKASQGQPDWLQKKRSLAIMLQKRFPLANQQQAWLAKWQELELVTNDESSLLNHDGDDFVALPINMAVQKYPELLQENLMEKAVRWQDNQLNALHLALMDTGQFIYVPDETKLEKPLKVGLVTRSNNPHNLIIVGAGAQVTVIEESDYKTQSPLFAATEILMGTGAQVKFCQNNHYHGDLVRQAVHSYQARGSKLEVEGVIPENQQGYSSFYSFLDGSDAHWNVQLASMVEADCQQEVVTQVVGYGENTSAQVNEWGWVAPNAQLKWGKLATVDDEPLELHQHRVIASNEKTVVNDQKEASHFNTPGDFFKAQLPANSWLARLS